MIKRNICFDGLLVITTCTEKVTGAELIESAHWMIENFDSLMKPGFSQLFDALQADTESVSEDDIHRIS
ncbi:MAG: hypothetical protein IMF14_05645, partial [Proteobacteria bacterium]|nr:hypothetical protein [Pseudomonadota bacterium]